MRHSGTVGTERPDLSGSYHLERLVVVHSAEVGNVDLGEAGVTLSYRLRTSYKTHDSRDRLLSLYLDRAPGRQGT